MVEQSDTLGTITIKLFKDKPAETTFSGYITGKDISVAWRALMKGYRLWKANSMKELEASKKQKGGK